MSRVVKIRVSELERGGELTAACPGDAALIGVAPTDPPAVQHLRGRGVGASGVETFHELGLRRGRNKKKDDNLNVSQNRESRQWGGGRVRWEEGSG